ncbi:MAG TPA: CopG family transcriptional regulator [Lentisphaeria bacterium]|nr:MAG: hypothetical protein A2X45_05900 [Lentisphaerae bacterium GWF2_50_93]HCE44793.1 CopG family transcriptional regulator [Lentisphaeria bacterium]
MIRTQVYLTKHEKTSLEKISASCNRKPSELIRMAIDSLIEKNGKAGRKEIIEKTAGAWKNRQDLDDIIALRKNWDRSFNS